MRRHVVPGRQNRALGVRTVKIVPLAVCTAAGLVWVGWSAAAAQNRPATKQYTNAQFSSASGSSAQSKTNDGQQMERKCVIMSCGTPWCYSVKR